MFIYQAAVEVPYEGYMSVRYFLTPQGAVEYANKLIEAFSPDSLGYLEVVTNMIWVEA